MAPMTVISCGMVTGVGFSAPATCAAIRVGIDAFTQTRFMLDGDWILGSEVAFEEGFMGREKLLTMAAMAVSECFAPIAGQCSLIDVPLCVCLPETDRPGRIEGLDSSFLSELNFRIGIDFAKSTSQCLSNGRCGGVDGLHWIEEQLSDGCRYGMIVGVDTFLVSESLAVYHNQNRLLTERYSNGFIPGEAAAAILLTKDPGPGRHLWVIGRGSAKEPAPLGADKPFRADGATAAIKAALQDSKVSPEEIDYRITDANGEQRSFKEASLASLRTVRYKKEILDIWHPADCVGEIGAATVPVALGVALTAGRKNYSPGDTSLMHWGNDAGERAALIARFMER
jgi:3-oxoacyl-[acyl-carrier-protein] synthase-1